MAQPLNAKTKQEAAHTTIFCRERLRACGATEIMAQIVARPWRQTNSFNEAGSLTSWLSLFIPIPLNKPTFHKMDEEQVGRDDDEEHKEKHRRWRHKSKMRSQWNKGQDEPNGDDIN